MNLIQTAIRQPVTVTVGVLLVLLSGVVALRRIPIQLTPNVEDTIVAVTTRWEGASPDEIEQEIVDEQEEKLQGIANLRAMTSQSLQGSGAIRLEFSVGTSKEAALREVSDKLREVPEYPENADEPVIEASDPENRDFIAWIILGSTDPELDIRTLHDFAEDRIKPVFERVAGMSEVNVLGGREREVQVRFDPATLAQRGVGIAQLADALRRTNRNVSGGEVEEGKSDVRLRLVNQYVDVGQVERTVIAETDAGPVLVRDVAEVVEDFKEPTTFVRSSGQSVIAINAQREVGSNVIEVMHGLQEAIEAVNAPGGLLDSEARARGLNGELRLRQVYDQTIYIDDALALVKDNIWVGSALAIAVLLVFLRSWRSAGIIALSIPISVVGAIAVMVALGRSINVISLAGMAFSVGMVVDNAIVVLENVFRHLEMGKTPARAALDGTREVWGAVLASTLTTLVVFVPILLIQEEAGQLFRDIALAIVASVGLSLVVSVTVVPVCAARLLKPAHAGAATAARKRKTLADRLGDFTYRTGGSVGLRLAIVVVLTVASIVGTYLMVPPADYLPQGNRNLVFGLIIPPPGYNLEQKIELSERIEQVMRPYFEAGKLEPGTPEYDAARAELPAVPTFDFATGQPGEPVVPPPLENYFIVGIEGQMFHGGISREPEHVVDYLTLFRVATRAEIAPGVLAFAFQVPLFQLGGRTGSAVKVNFAGDDLDEVARAALAVYGEMIQRYGVYSVQPDPSNFNVPGPELQVVPDLVRLSEVGLSAEELGLAVLALGDGAIIGDYRIGGRNVDLKVLSSAARGEDAGGSLADAPIATPRGGVVPLASLGRLQRVNAPPQINRENRQRAVTLQLTPPPGLALEEAIEQVDRLLLDHRTRGSIPPGVATSYSGSASKLASVREAMFGDGTLVGTLGSAMVLALLVVYLLMCVLFQSFMSPLIIMFSVPLATLGGFAALYGVHVWSKSDPYMPVQSLDVLTLLGFVILIGVVVNNAILIVHQARNFMLGEGGEGEATTPLPAREAIAESVRSRVRPILMSSLTSVLGMAPLVLMPGSGSELYRGLGSVVVGGLLVSTIFTLFLVPALLGLVLDLQRRMGWGQAQVGARSDALRGAAPLVLLALALGLSGCAHPPRPSPEIERRTRELADAALAPLPEDARTGPVPDEPARVETALAGRIDELEATAGPDSLDDVELDLPDTLDGLDASTQAIDLEQVVRSAAEHNLGLRITRVETLIGQDGIVVAEAEFDPALFSEAFYEDAEAPNTVAVINGIALGRPEFAQRDALLEVGLRQRLASGATLSASSFVERFDDQTSGISFTPDPAYHSGLALVLSQPLLRGFGSDVTLADIALRRNDYERSEELLREDLSVVKAAAQSSYWDLHQAWKSYAIHQELERQGAEVERVLAERRAFDATPAEYSDALATLEERRANGVRARRLLALASDRLKVLLNDPELPLASEVLLRPSGRFAPEAPAFDLAESIETALGERPEVARALLGIEDADLRVRVATSLREAKLDLAAGVSVAGLDDGLEDSFESLAHDDFYTVFLGLSFELPIGNRAAAARRRQAVNENRIALIAYERTVRDVTLSVKEALRDVRTNYELIGASRAFRLAQTENLRALLAEEESRTDMTPEFLALKFQRQERLAEARLREVAALADYQRSIAAFQRALGQ